MSNETNNTFAMSVPAEIAFPPALFEKRKPTPKAEPRYEMAISLPADHPDLPAIKAMCKQIAEKNQPGVTASASAWKYPWQSADAFIARQETKEKKYDNSHLAGKVIFNSHSTKYEPKLSVLMPGRGVVDFWDEAARQTVKDKFYAGCQVLCEFSLVWYPPNNGIPGVTAYLNKVLSLNKGERRAGGRSGAETFSGYVGKMSAVDPTAGMPGSEEY